MHGCTFTIEKVFILVPIESPVFHSNGLRFGLQMLFIFSFQMVFRFEFHFIWFSDLIFKWFSNLALKWFSDLSSKWFSNLSFKWFSGLSFKCFSDLSFKSLSKYEYLCKYQSETPLQHQLLNLRHLLSLLLPIYYSLFLVCTV